MSPDAMDPKPFPAPHTPQGDSIGWAKRNSFIQRSLDRNNPLKFQRFALKRAE